MTRETLRRYVIPTIEATVRNLIGAAGLGACAAFLLMAVVTVAGWIGAHL
jgi:hypothetical protein